MTSSIQNTSALMDTPLHELPNALPDTVLDVSVTTRGVLALQRAHTLLEEWLDERWPYWCRPQENESLVNTARLLSSHYTSGSQAQQASFDTPLAVGAYLAYFAPRGLAALAHLVDLLPLHTLHAHTRIADLGAGPAVSALLLQPLGVAKVYAVERSNTAMQYAEQFWSNRSRSVGNFSLVCHRAEVAHAPKLENADTMLTSFLWGELGAAEDAALVATAWQSIIRVTPNAKTVLMLDAGDAKHARSLQTLRQHLIDTKHHILGPCRHHDACPALQKQRDWCHRQIPRLLSPRLAAFAAQVGRDEDTMSVSSLAIDRRPLFAQDTDDTSSNVAAQQQDFPIVTIGQPQRDKGRVRLPVCGPDGLRYIQAQKRDKDLYRSLDTALTGAVWPSLSAYQRGDTAFLRPHDAAEQN